MATSIGDLIQDVEKRMKELGYEDTEKLQNPTITVEELKLLKRKLMDEKKERQEAKKKRKENTTVLRDLLVKLSKIYKKDLYLTKCALAMPGKLSRHECGQVLIRIDQDVVDHVKKIISTDSKVLFIPDITTLKGLVDEFFEEEDKIFATAVERGVIDILDEKSTLAVLEHLENEIDAISKDANLFKTIQIDMSIPEIITLKDRFKIQFLPEYPEIDVNLDLFPFCEVKEDGTLNVDFMSGTFEELGSNNMYYARFKVYAKLFDIYLKKYYI